MLWTKMMFSLLFTKSITDLVEWLKKGHKSLQERYKHQRPETLFLRLLGGDNSIVFQTDESLNSPPPHMHVSLQGKQQVSE